MNRSDLIRDVAFRTRHTHNDVELILKTAFARIEQTVKAGEDVNIHEFGKFKLTCRKAHTGHNPMTGEAIDVPAKQYVTFKKEV